MFSSYGVHGFLRKYMLFLAIYGDQPFGCWKNSIKGVHSLIQFKQKKPIRQINRKVRKSVKPIESNDVDPKVYMRDTIGNISKILRYSIWDSAQEQLEKLPIRWDSYVVNQVLKTHPLMEKAWLFFNWAFRLKGFKHDQFTYTTNYVYQQMQEKGIKIDAVTYTSLLHWLSKDRDIDGSVKTWKEMKANGCCPTVVSYTAYMKVLFDNNREKEATDIYKEMLQSGCSPNCYTYTILMEYLVGSGKYKAALEIFSKMQEAGVLPDKATCNILFEKCCKTGETWAMTQILQYMKDNSLVLRYPVYLEALETLKTAGESDFLLSDQKNSATYTALINAYFFCGSVDKGLKIYESMQNNGIHPTLGTYNVLLTGLQKSGRVREAEIYRKERKNLQTVIHAQDIFSLDEKICDLLFAGHAVP